MTNTLYYGDNLDILRQHVGDESVDQVYLCRPPFGTRVERVHTTWCSKDRAGDIGVSETSSQIQRAI